MGQSRLRPSVADEAPFENTLTSYDERHLLVYADLLETETDGGDWDEAALLVLRIDPVLEAFGNYFVGFVARPIGGYLGITLAYLGLMREKRFRCT